MTVYRQKTSQPLKWLVALIVFALAMGVTFTDVYGYDGSSSAGAGNDNDNNQNGAGNDNLTTSNDRTGSPSAIPEPTTLILLGGGLGVLYVVRRWRKKN